MMRMSLAAALVIAGSLNHAVAAEVGDDGRRLAAACTVCHAPQNKGSGVEPLAGVPKDALYRAMQDFRDGVRPATVMRPLAKGYSSAQIAAIAGHFAVQKP